MKTEVKTIYGFYNIKLLEAVPNRFMSLPLGEKINFSLKKYLLSKDYFLNYIQIFK